MTTITVEIKKTNPELKKLLSQVSAGQEIVFKQGDKLIARLVPAGKRIAGLHAGKVKMSKDFDAPLPDDFWAGEKG